MPTIRLKGWNGRGTVTFTSEDGRKVEITIRRGIDKRRLSIEVDRNELKKAVKKV